VRFGHIKDRDIVRFTFYFFKLVCFLFEILSRVLKFGYNIRSSNDP
jgi:hypothetical protein